jgi:hypothetical protein
LKAHIGANSKTSVVHSDYTTPASVSDAHVLPELLQSAKKKVREMLVIKARAPYSQGRARDTGYDFAAGDNKGRRGRVGEAQKPHQAPVRATMA